MLLVPRPSLPLLGLETALVSGLQGHCDQRVPEAVSRTRCLEMLFQCAWAWACTCSLPHAAQNGCNFVTPCLKRCGPGVVQLDARLQLWQAVRAWEDAHAAWELSPISGLDLAGVAAQLQDFQAAADRLEAILPPNAVGAWAAAEGLVSSTHMRLMQACSFFCRCCIGGSLSTGQDSILQEGSGAALTALALCCMPAAAVPAGVRATAACSREGHAGAAACAGSIAKCIPEGGTLAAPAGRAAASRHQQRRRPPPARLSGSTGAIDSPLLLPHLLACSGCTMQYMSKLLLLLMQGEAIQVAAHLRAHSPQQPHVWQRMAKHTESPAAQKP